MRSASVVVPARTWALETACDAITLDYDARHRRRFRYIADGGTAFLLDLPRVVALQDGDGLQLDNGEIIAVRAAAESLIEVTAADSQTLVRLAWHIGNRHLPAQLDAQRILIRADHVIVAMLQGLGAGTRELLAPFTPESGAYAAAHGHGGGERAAEYVFVAQHGH